MSDLNESQRMAPKNLESTGPDCMSAEGVGQEVCAQICIERWGSAFGMPLCNKPISAGLAVQNEVGDYLVANGLPAVAGAKRT